MSEDRLVSPITPQEAKSQRKNFIPSEVVEAVNELICKKLQADGSVFFLQKEVVAAIRKKMPHLTSNDIYTKQYLDFEQIFRDAGWDVIYDKPAYCENYEANFTFKPKKG